MKIKHLQQAIVALVFFGTIGIAGCQSSSPPANPESSETAETKRLSPQRVDVRGNIVARRYNEGQVVLEVEGFGVSPDTRYQRAYVLVLPTTPIVGPEGQNISYNELQMGQNVSIIMRSGGQGNMVGVGVARKVWVE